MPGQSPLLIVTQVAPYRDGPAGVHGVLDQAAVALAELGAMAGLDPVRVSDVASIDDGQLTAGGVLALFTIGETPFSPTQRAAIRVAWDRGELDVFGVHSATDACAGWDDYGKIVGARFDGHPWTQSFEVEVADRDHPATAHLPERWQWHDEVYLFRALQSDARVLLRLAPDQLDMTVNGARTPDCGFPLAWCREAGHARSFYSALGHFPSAWESPTFLQHLFGGLSWLRARDTLAHASLPH